jgi:hypothetical protein
VRRILEKAALSRGTDLEAWETAIRTAVLAAGAKALGELLQGIGSGKEPQAIVCTKCGVRMESQGLKRKELLTILGQVAFERSMFQCPVCQDTRYPGDEALDIVGTTRSPGLRRMMARAGSQTTFKDGRDDLTIYAGLQVSAKDVERVAEGIGQQIEAWLFQERRTLLIQAESLRTDQTIPILYISYDGTGVPMTPEELQGRKGKQLDGSARTREAKLGCIFTQTITDEKGFPLRDPDSTSFVGAIESAEEFGWRICAEAVRRGLFQAKRVVVLADSAEWIKNLWQLHFPMAMFIVDLYHAREHVSHLSKMLFGSDTKRSEQQRIRWWTDLDAGKVDKIIRQARQWLSDQESREKAETEIHYFEKNKAYMRYAEFRAQGLFVGSGVIEAGCKTVIGQRLKQSGMEWSVHGANAIISLRCAIKSNRFEDYWESRVS